MQTTNFFFGWYHDKDWDSSTSFTPNIDLFQQDSVSFTRAYVQYALCNPSRASFLTGLRPITTRVFDLNKYFRDTIKNGDSIITIPQYFQDYKNYYTVGSGKIFHHDRASGGIGRTCNTGCDRKYSWNDYYSCSGTGKQPFDFCYAVLNHVDILSCFDQVDVDVIRFYVNYR